MFNLNRGRFICEASAYLGHLGSSFMMPVDGNMASVAQLYQGSYTVERIFFSGTSKVVLLTITRHQQWGTTDSVSSFAVATRKGDAVVPH